VILLLFAFVKYQEEKKLIEPDSKDAAIAKELLSRVKDLKDVNEPVGIWDENGNFLDVTDATVVDEDGNITKVTKYETFKDKYGNDVQVKLKKQIEKTKDGKIIESWGFDRPYRMLTKYYSGEIKEIRENSIVFLVESESDFEEFEVHHHYLKDVKDYEKIFDFNNYDLKNDKGFMIPPDEIIIGFKKMVNIKDFERYLNKKINIQESITTFFKDSPESITIAFSEYY
jgi:ribosome maturation factor RimP